MRLLSALIVASLAFAADLPTGESLMQLSLERSGGAEAFAKARNMVMTGTVDMVGHNITGPVSVYEENGKSYTAIELPGIGKVEEGFDGETAWEMNALQGARVKDGPEKDLMKRSSKITMLDNWRDYYKKARTVGSEDVDGKSAWKIELTPNDGKPEYFFFDKQSGLLVQMSQTVATPLGEIPVDVILSDYRVVDGIKTPFAMTQKAINQTLAMRFDKVVFNASIPAGRFDPPPAVKALLAKKKP